MCKNKDGEMMVEPDGYNFANYYCADSICTQNDFILGDDGEDFKCCDFSWFWKR